MEDRTTGNLLEARFSDLGDGAAIMSLTGEIDISSAHVLTSQFEAVVRDGLTDVIIDATAVTFMDSTGLHALVEGKRLIHGKGTNIVLLPSAQVRRVLELVFPEPLFATRMDSLDEAIASLNGRKRDQVV